MKLNLQLTAELATGSTTPILVGVADDVERVEIDDKRRPGNRIGTRYAILMQQAEYASTASRPPHTRAGMGLA